MRSHVTKKDVSSGAVKRKKKRTEEEKKEQDKGTLLKYFGAQPTLPGPDVSSSVSASTADDTAGSSTAELQAPESEKQLQALTFTDTSVSTSAGMTGPSTPAPTAIDFPTAPPIDPVEWSELLSDSERTDLVRRGPVPISDTFTFPKKSDGRSFHYHYTYRQLANNGNFLKEVELIAKFDPVLKDHIRQIDSGIQHNTYLVTLGKAPEIKEHFLGFLIAPESTGLGLSSLILNRLQELNIPFHDCRGQSYDNGANMKGKNKGGPSYGSLLTSPSSPGVRHAGKAG
ncbi:uncharacterized protein LOC130430665 [Triplophysa dalaica]|uniref:uncharacterized protein LOC130430665 n=1 Tax=Triplophysa dalaica TaxID=1582913 RepID=UPI0024DFA633|nr:uncharacterized protein LOC130430665 [Triplophysa dalaica]